MYTQFWSEDLKGRDHLEDLGTDKIVEKQDRRMWTEFIWLRTGTNGGSLCSQ